MTMTTLQFAQALFAATLWVIVPSALSTTYIVLKLLTKLLYSCYTACVNKLTKGHQKYEVTRWHQQNTNSNQFDQKPTGNI